MAKTKITPTDSNEATTTKANKSINPYFTPFTDTNDKENVIIQKKYRRKFRYVNW